MLNRLSSVYLKLFTIQRCLSWNYQPTGAVLEQSAKKEQDQIKVDKKRDFHVNVERFSVNNKTAESWFSEKKKFNEKLQLLVF